MPGVSPPAEEDADVVVLRWGTLTGTTAAGLSGQSNSVRWHHAVLAQLPAHQTIMFLLAETRIYF